MLTRIQAGITSGHLEVRKIYKTSKQFDLKHKAEWNIEKERESLLSNHIFQMEILSIHLKALIPISILVPNVSVCNQDHIKYVTCRLGSWWKKKRAWKYFFQALDLSAQQLFSWRVFPWLLRRKPSSSCWCCCLKDHFFTWIGKKSFNNLSENKVCGSG